MVLLSGVGLMGCNGIIFVWMQSAYILHVLNARIDAASANDHTASRGWTAAAESILKFLQAEGNASYSPN
jgi:hypothetical protein